MSILVPVVSTGITLNEVPDHIAFYAEMGECTQHCKGCHSPHLWEPLESKMKLEDLYQLASDAIDKKANAIVLMGGTTNGVSTNVLIFIINALSEIAPVCLYSGSDDKALNEMIAYHSNLTWIKTGSFREDLGGLSSPKTNQHFYKKEYEYNVRRGSVEKYTPLLIDYTEVFQNDCIG